MKRSEQILLAILLVGVLVWFGRGPVTRLFYEPVEQLDSQIEMIERQTAQLELEEIQLMSAAKRLKSWKRLSLPPDPLTAQRLYQTWLTDLASKVGLQDLKVTPESRNPAGKAFVAVQVRLKANGTLAQIVLFLREFHRTELLHRINSIELDSDISGLSPDISVTLVAEGIALTDAPRRNWLFPQTTLVESIAAGEKNIMLKDASEFSERAGFSVRLEEETLLVRQTDGDFWSVERGYDSSTPVAHQAGTIVQLIPVRSLTAAAAGETAALIVANPFLRPVPSVAANQESVKATGSEIDEADYIFLISAIADGDEREAWLFNRLDNTKRVVKENELISVAGLDGMLLKIQRDFVLIRHNDATWRLSVGENLSSLHREQD